MNVHQRTRLVYILYVVAPLVSGLDSVIYGRVQFGILYLALGLLYALVLLFLRKIPPGNSRMLQTVGALLLIVISFDLFRQGRNVLPYLYIFAAVLNLYVLYIGKKEPREKRRPGTEIKENWRKEDRRPEEHADTVEE
jgi:predicted membrane protein